MCANYQGPGFSIVNGFKFPVDIPVEKISSGLTYEALPDDLFIVTYPKCGTTWTQQIVTLMLNDGDIPDETESGLLSSSPFLELTGKEAAETMRRPGAIKTHLPFSMQPWSETARYIIVLRNPKDCCVSYYHHLKLFPKYYDKGASFHQFLPYFLSGSLGYEGYFDWVLSWWAKKDEKTNIKFFLYEDMKAEPKKEFLDIARFIGNGLEEKLLANEEEILKKVLQKSSLEHMKTTNKVFEKLVKSHGNLVDGQFEFVRKGIVGDWKNHFTQEENQLIEKMTSERFAGTGLDKIWDKHSN